MRKYVYILLLAFYLSKQSEETYEIKVEKLSRTMVSIIFRPWNWKGIKYFAYKNLMSWQKTKRFVHGMRKIFPPFLNLNFSYFTYMKFATF